MFLTDILILGIIIGGFLFYIINKKFTNIKIKRILANAKKAEKEAVYLLSNHGYRIISMQEKRNIITYIDGKPYPSYVKVDLIVQKKGKRYIVEVKTGQQTKATTALVRRQLLEYYLVFNPEGIILLDMDRKKIQTIEFNWDTHSFRWKGIIIAAIFG